MKIEILLSFLAFQCYCVHARSLVVIHEAIFIGQGLRPLTTGNFTCPAQDGFYAIPNYCGSDYYTCISGSPYVSTCPNYAIFDPLTLKCTPVEYASCKPTFNCPSSDGFYAIPGVCSGNFYNCIGGQAYEESCPGNTIFDPITNICTRPENASCKPATTTTRGPTTTVTIPTTQSTSTTQLPTTTVTIPTTQSTSTTQLPTTTVTIPTTLSTSTTQLPTTTVTIPTTQSTTSTTNGVFNCPASGGFYPIPGQCSGSYYACVNGFPYLQNCPGNAIYDPLVGTCVPAELASCSTTTPRTTVTSTTASTSTGPTTTVTGTTPTTTVITTTRPTTVSSSAPSTTTLPPTPGTFVCPEPDGIFPVPGQQCSSNFWKCANSYSYLMSCPASTYFNPALLVCDYPQNISGCR